MADVIPDNNAKHPGDRLDREKIIEVIQRSLHTLSEREEKIIRLRFGISDDIHNHTDFPVTKGELKNIKDKAIIIS